MIVLFIPFVDWAAERTYYQKLIIFQGATTKAVAPTIVSLTLPNGTSSSI
ncbi:hypothetical protein [Lacrimispora brassicae]